MAAKHTIAPLPTLAARITPIRLNALGAATVSGLRPDPRYDGGETPSTIAAVLVLAPRIRQR